MKKQYITITEEMISQILHILLSDYPREHPDYEKTIRILQWILKEEEN